jgi:quinol monooxygenase YgiN
MIYEATRYTVRPGTVDACKDAVRELVEHVRENEEGTLLYVVLQEDEDDHRFLHLGTFENRRAREAHRESDAMRFFLNLVYPATVDGISVTETTVVDRIPSRRARAVAT